MLSCAWSYRWQKGLSRYYKVYVYKDLFGDLILTKVWGGMNSRLGNFEHIKIDDYQSALAIIEEINSVRQKRKYELISKTQE